MGLPGSWADELGGLNMEKAKLESFLSYKGSIEKVILQS